jgi:four helix bundle protein
MPIPSGPQVRSFKDLKVWQVAMELVSAVYRLTEGYPKREWYGLTAQMRRAAVSIPANVAEGRGRFTTREFIRFLRIAIGSLRELETYCELSLRLEYATAEQIQMIVRLTDETASMLVGLAAALQKRARTAH